MVIDGFGRINSDIMDTEIQTLSTSPDGVESLPHLGYAYPGLWNDRDSNWPVDLSSLVIPKLSGPVWPWLF